MSDIKTKDIITCKNGKYRIGKRIGKGGLGIVFKGHSLSDNTEVAIKILHQDRFKSRTSILERFGREIKYGFKFNHPNLAQVIDYRVGNDTQKDCYLVMKYINGETLDKKIGYLGMKESISIAIDIIKGLIYLHGQGLIHRDLKPNNIMIRTTNDKSKALIIDFGLIKKCGEDIYITNNMDQLGSILYISDHQRYNPGNADFKDDIYSLCVVLYEIFSGERISLKWNPNKITYHAIREYITNVLNEFIHREQYPSLTKILYALENIQKPKIQKIDGYSPHIEEDRDRLIQKYLPLINSIVKRIASRLRQKIIVGDLMEAGIIGLLDAIKNFDISKKVKFKTYAEFRIRGAILDELRAHGWTSRSVHQNVKRIEKAILEVEQKTGKPATDEEVAQEMNMPLETYHKLIDQVRNVCIISFEDLSKVLPIDEKQNILERLKSPQDEFIYEKVNLKQIKNLFSKAINELHPKDQMILSLYYWDELTMKEIGSIMGLAESTIKRRHTKAMLLLKKKLRDMMTS